MASILRIATPAPLRHTFDYLPPPVYNSSRLVPGMRVKVPFGRVTAIGIVVEIATRSRIAGQHLKYALAVLDDDALLPPDSLALLLWASAYYHYPIGEVILSALPAPLRRGQAPRARGVRSWRLTEAGAEMDPSLLARAPLQAKLVSLLRAHPEGARADQLIGSAARATLQRLVAKGWAEERESPCLGPLQTAHLDEPPGLNEAQHRAVEAVAMARGFQPFLLDGVTGSGKTEVYLRVIERVVAGGAQAMVLVPEIGLTPQLVGRFRRRFHVPVAVLHSALSDQERLCAWLMARDGTARIVIGTRSAVFTPLPNPGIFIIDEEHDLSFKQQEGFRYHARDVAIMRASRAQVPILLGSATPSLESLYNVDQRRYQRLVLPERAGGAVPPQLTVVDLRHQSMEGKLSRPLLKTVEQHLARGEQALLFLNRRGYAPTLICHDCAWLATCARCDARLVVHQRRQALSCHHCGAERVLPGRCPSCAGDDLRAWGQGTERLEEVLARHYPNIGMVRIDRDSTRRKGTMQTLLDSVHAGNSQILIGTQMLAKGHHLPEVTLAAILDADQGLFGVDFRGPERMAQTILQVAGRAGRSLKQGHVVIQTHYPHHPLLHTLINQGYHSFAQAALRERRRAQLPPYTCMALLRAEAANREAPEAFLRAAQAQIPDHSTVQSWGPVPAPMERRAGRYRAQLLLQAGRRAALHRLLDTWVPELEGLKLARKVRWSLDVDPMEML